MSLNARITSSSRIIAQVNKTGDSLSSAKPITLKNQINEIRSIEDISDVAEVEVVSGATLVYNSQTDKYEVRPLEIGDLGNIDGGTF